MVSTDVHARELTWYQECSSDVDCDILQTMSCHDALYVVSPVEKDDGSVLVALSERAHDRTRVISSILVGNDGANVALFYDPRQCGSNQEAR